MIDLNEHAQKAIEKALKDCQQKNEAQQWRAQND